MKELEIFLRKLLLKLYLFFCEEAEKKDRFQVEHNSKILFVRLNRIGDALVTTPLIKLIKENTGCEISVLADSKNHFIFRNLPFVDNVYTFPKKFGEIKKLKEKINSRNYDAVFDLHDDVSTTVTLFIGGLKNNNKIAFNKSNKKIFNYLVPYLNPENNHVIDRYLSFADFLKIKYDKNSVKVCYPLADEIKLCIDKYMKNEFPEDKLLIGINISAGSKARFWGIDRYKKLISYFRNYDVDILIISSVEDESLAKHLLYTDVKLFVNPDFNHFAACVSKLDFLFTPDTSIIHLASAYNVPVFGIYVKYNTRNMIWSPYNTEFEAVITEEPTFENLGYKNVQNKLKPFFEKIYYEKRNTGL